MLMGLANIISRLNGLIYRAIMQNCGCALQLSRHVFSDRMFQEKEAE